MLQRATNQHPEQLRRAGQAALLVGEIAVPAAQRLRARDAASLVSDLADPAERVPDSARGRYYSVQIQSLGAEKNSKK